VCWRAGALAFKREDIHRPPDAKPGWACHPVPPRAAHAEIPTCSANEFAHDLWGRRARRGSQLELVRFCSCGLALSSGVMPVIGRGCGRADSTENLSVSCARSAGRRDGGIRAHLEAMLERK